MIRLVPVWCALVLAGTGVGCSAGSVTASGPTANEAESGAPVLSLNASVTTGAGQQGVESQAAVKKRAPEVRVRTRPSKRARARERLADATTDAAATPRARSIDAAADGPARFDEDDDGAPLAAPLITPSTPSLRAAARAPVSATVGELAGSGVGTRLSPTLVEFETEGEDEGEVEDESAESEDFLERGEDEDDVALEDEGDRVTYHAWALPGARNRLVIARVNAAETGGSCTRIVLVHPDNLEQWATLPAGWAIEHAWTSDDPSACAHKHGAPRPEDPSTMDGDGQVTWSATHGVYPCELAIEMVLEFPGANAARSISFVAPKLTVEGCRSPGPRTASVAVSG